MENEKNSVLIVTTTFPRYENDFWANFLLNLVKNLSINVKVIAPHFPNGKKTDVLDNVKIERFKYFFNNLETLAYGDGIAINIQKKKSLLFLVPFFFVSFLIKIIKEYRKSDIIHAQLAPAGLVSVIAGKFFRVKKPILTSFYGNDVVHCEKNKLLYNCLFKGGKLFFVLGEDMKNSLIKIGCKKEKIVIFPLGVNIEEFKVKRIYGNEIKFLIIGRFIEKKGIEYGIFAFNECYKKYKHISMRIIGTGGLINKYNELLKELKLENVIKIEDSSKFNKPRVESIMAYKECDVFVLSSITASNGDKEGTPVVLMEAQAAGMPCISTFHSDIPNVVLNGKTGFLSKEKDYLDMSKNMMKLIEDKDLMIKMSKAAEMFIEENYNLKKQNGTKLGCCGKEDQAHNSAKRIDFNLGSPM